MKRTRGGIKRLRGFTLIESLAVIAIIGMLLSLGGYLFIQAQAQARDAKRKSDLDQIAQAFGARQLDRTCADQSATGVYPGESIEGSNAQVWLKTSQLQSYSDGCGSFNQYLPTMPTDRRTGFFYYFNLSTTEVVAGKSVSAPAKHYRLTTALEHTLSTTELQECVRLSKIWINSFGGQPYDCDQHVITQLPTLLAAVTNGQHEFLADSPICQTIPDGGPPPPDGCNNNGGGPDGGGPNGGGPNGGGPGNNTPGPYNYYIGQ